MAGNKTSSPSARAKRAVAAGRRRDAARQAEFDFSLANATSARDRRAIRAEAGSGRWANVDARRNSRGSRQAAENVQDFSARGRANIDRYRLGRAAAAERRSEAARQERLAARRVRDGARREAARAAAAAAIAAATPRTRRARRAR